MASSSSSSALVLSAPHTGSRPQSSSSAPPAYTSLLVPHTASLPYIDRELDVSKWSARVEAEVAAEARASASSRKAVDQRIEQVLGPAYDWNSTSKLSEQTRSELEKMARGEPLERPPLFDMGKFAVPGPERGAEASAAEWQAALDNARIQLAAQQVRSDNVSLLKTYGTNAWRMHAFHLETDLNRAEKTLERAHQETNLLNRGRRDAQLAASDVRPSAKHRLEQANTKWNTLVSNALQISVANVAAEREIDQLQAKRRKLTQQLLA